jgi:CSLREA domain-containing protein
MQICVVDNMEMVEGDKHPTAASTTTCKEIGVSVEDMVDLTIDLDAAHNPLTPAQPLILTANVLNQDPEQGGGITATDVGVTVTLPEEVTYVAAITLAGTCQQDGGELVCRMDNLASGSSAQIVIQATVDNHVVGDTLEVTAIVETSAINQVEASFDYEEIVLVGAADYVVNTIADTADADSGDGICADSDGSCSLRAAIEQTSDSDSSRIIALGDGVYEISGTLRTSGDVELIGLGATRTIVRNKDAEKALFAESGRLTIRNTGISGGILNFEADVVLDNVAISGANGQEPNYGGGLYNVRGNTTVRNSSIAANRATQGGGVYNGGTLTMLNVTVSGNSADMHGGISNNGTLTLTHVTISHNEAQSGAGGLGLNDSVSTTLQHTLIGKNKVGSTAADCSGSFASSGHNLLESGCESSLVSSDLSGIDPRLETLNLNGAETLTIGLQEDSPALNAGGSTVTVDQRGVNRDSAADIGAYERVAASRIVYLPVVVR